MGKYKAKKVICNVRTKETTIAFTPSTVINTNKLVNKKEIITFDSKLEFKVYELILKNFDQDKVLVHNTYNLNNSIFIDELNLGKKSSRFTDLLKFNPDFTIINDSNKTSPLRECELIIEAKGLLTKDYILKLYIFLQFFPELASKYLVVFCNNNYLRSSSFRILISQFSFIALTIDQLNDYLINTN